MTTLGYAIVFVSDMDKSIAFYRDVLGFSPTHQSQKWTECDVGGITLALHLADAADQSHAHTHEAMPTGHCQIGLTVPDLNAFHAEMVARALPFRSRRRKNISGGWRSTPIRMGCPFSVFRGGVAAQDIWEDPRNGRKSHC